ncbi:hypothetical protein BDW74DRAFT_145242 [Aspergillus multicolor]|uniref:uncharacterized protein n=1 Tax=Aspergillus multicolor TaxID=41759 RepID=UPI003CCDB4A3
MSYRGSTNTTHFRFPSLSVIFLAHLSTIINALNSFIFLSLHSFPKSTDRFDHRS